MADESIKIRHESVARDLMVLYNYAHNTCRLLKEGAKITKLPLKSDAHVLTLSSLEIMLSNLLLIRVCLIVIELMELNLQMSTTSFLSYTNLMSVVRKKI